jgi:uncharacterized membrane protein YcjF (UPF0283 family)
MSRRPRSRFWIEVAIFLASLVSLAATLVDPEWIEAVFGVEPDGGSGELEWAIVATLAALTLLSASLTWLEWRRPVPTPAD